MDGTTVVVIAVLVGPLYPIIIHNAIQTRLNKKLLEKLNDKRQGEEG